MHASFSMNYPDCISVLVNKTHSLPSWYCPKDLYLPNIPFSENHFHPKKLLRFHAAYAINQLFTEARKHNYFFYGVSGFRSYQRQKNIYEKNLATKGKIHTELYSAKPGHSEHQTGLAMDVSISSLQYDLLPKFGDTKEGIWLSKNCHRFGFILRYPKDKSHITGYHYEPWHIRYIGPVLALFLFENHLTLEEYMLGLVIK